MSDERLRIGRQGEEIAARFLERKGYRIIHRNYRGKGCEIDLIATWNSTLVFIEVKTRTSSKFGNPAHAVNYRKQRQISNAAMQYLSRERAGDQDARFDVITVILQGTGQTRIDHITDAFELQCAG